MQRTFCICVVSSELIVLVLVVVTSAKHFATSDYTISDVIFATVVIGVCVLLLKVTITCIYLYRKRARSHDNTDNEDLKRGMSTNTAKLSHLMKKINHIYGSDCAICLEEKQSSRRTIVELSCSHSFHKKCIHQYFRRSNSNTCPLCRQISQPHRALKVHKVKGNDEKVKFLEPSMV